MTQGELPAHQTRSRAAREKIVGALDTLLKEKPFDQVSVAEIATRAEVAVGTVYQRFKNKEALIPVVFEIYKNRVEKWMAGDGRVELETDDDLRSALRKVFRQSWSIMKRESHLLRTVHIHVRLKPELVAGEEWKQIAQASASSIRAIIEYFSSEVKRKDITRAATFSAYFFNSIMIEKGLYADTLPAILFKQKGPAFADECADMLYGYLTLM